MAKRAGRRWRLAGAVAFVVVAAGLLALAGPVGVRPARADDDDRGGFDRFDDDRFDARDAGGGARDAGITRPGAPMPEASADTGTKRRRDYAASGSNDTP